MIGPSPNLERRSQPERWATKICLPGGEALGAVSRKTRLLGDLNCWRLSVDSQESKKSPEPTPWGLGGAHSHGLYYP